MRLDTHKTFLFHDVDRHGTVKNPVSGMLVGDFTIMIRFSPDLNSIKEVLERRKDNPKYDTVYHKTCVLGKNGKHTGVFFTSYINGVGELVHSVEYEWWQNPLWEKNQNPEEDEVKSLKIFVDPNTVSTFDVIVEKYKGKISMQVNDERVEDTYDCVIDYSMSLMWLGAANRLLDDSDKYDEGFACVYTGDVSLLHVQQAPMMKFKQEVFFNDFDKFKNFGYDTIQDIIYISTDFSQTTELKARDFSGNGLHPLVYSREWIG